MPLAKLEHSRAVLDGMISIMGGANARVLPIMRGDVYDPAADVRDQAGAPLPCGREHLAAMALADKV